MAKNGTWVTSLGMLPGPTEKILGPAVLVVGSGEDFANGLYLIDELLEFSRPQRVHTQEDGRKTILWPNQTGTANCCYRIYDEVVGGDILYNTGVQVLGGSDFVPGNIAPPWQNNPFEWTTGASPAPLPKIYPIAWRRVHEIIAGRTAKYYPIKQKRIEQLI